jgi:hypothetical protein
MQRPLWALLILVVLCTLWTGQALGQAYVSGDFNEDGLVDIRDLTILAAQWLDPDCLNPGCEADVDHRNGVNAQDFSFFANNWASGTDSLVISEFMASNSGRLSPADGGLLDEDGASSDWIEIFNPTGHTISLDNWHLTNNRNKLNQWEFPTGLSLDPSEFLIVFASNKDRSVAGAELHTNFELNAEGDYLALVKDDGSIAHEYAPEFPRQVADVSYGLLQYADTFVPIGAVISYHVPGPNDAGHNWMSLGFDDSGWQSTTAGLGFAGAPQEAACDIGSPSAPGSHSLDNGVYTVLGDGQDIGGYADSFYFIYRPLSGDGQLTARVSSMSRGHDWAKAGVMLRESLSGSSRHVCQVITGRQGAAFVRRTETGGFTTTTSGGIISPPYWVRITRKGNKITGYHSPDGLNWTAQGSEIMALPKDVYVGLCVSSYQPGILSTATFDNVNTGTEVFAELKQQMLGVNSSLWTRVEFVAEDTGSLTSMILRMKYEDGFVAYLNGVEIARANFTGAPAVSLPNQPAWNSRSDTDRDNKLADDFSSFDVSSRIGLLRHGTNVLAVQGLNNSKDDEDFLLVPEVVATGEANVQQYFTTPSPRRFNTSATANIVADTQFSHNRGFYDKPFAVTIVCPTEGVTIHYTTDGSAPSPARGQEYTSPIPINTTTCLRAMAFKTGWVPTNVDTHTYIFLDDVIRQPANPPGYPISWGGTAADYEMDPEVVNNSQYRNQMRDSLLSLPTMSIVTDVANMFGPSGIYTNSTAEGLTWERPTSLEWINPDGTTRFQVNAGLRIYGGAFRGMGLTRKKSFRLFFKRNYGPTKLHCPLFGEDATDEFDTIILRGGANDAWNNWGNVNTQYIVDEFMRRTQLALGQPSGHGTFVHLYINGLYWGLYNAVERPDASFCATYFGGDKEDWDSIHDGTPVNGDTAAWNQMLSKCSAGLISNEAYQRLQGNYPDGTDNPDYEDYLDVENYADYMFSNFWGGTGDWPWHNFYTGRYRLPVSTGYKFFNWDSEGAIVVWSDLNANVTNQTVGVGQPYGALRQNKEFCQLFGDHSYRHLLNDGPADSIASYARYKELADEVDLAIIAESARWGDMARSTPYTQADWRTMRDYVLRTYMPQRPAIVLEQLRSAGLYPSINPPQFMINGAAKPGGYVTSGDRLSMTTTSGAIYYSLEGHDPRLMGGVLNPKAILLPAGSAAQQITLVPENADKRAFVPSATTANDWKTLLTFDDSKWLLCTGSPGGVGFERGTGYETHISLDVGPQMYNVNSTCYLRIRFNVASKDLANLSKLTLGVKYDDGFVAYLNGTKVASRNFTSEPAWNSAASSSHPDPDAVSFESIDITSFLSSLKPGDNLLAIHAMNTAAAGSDFLISVQLTAQTRGGSSSDIILSHSTRVTARALSGTTWSALNEAVFGVGPVKENLRITEIMYHPCDATNASDPNDPNEEYIELKNIGSQTINLNLVKFTNGIDFAFGDVNLAPGASTVIVENKTAFQARYGTTIPMAGQYIGKLDNAGERIRLVDALGTTILDFKYADGWRDVTDGQGYSLTIINPANPDVNSWDIKDSWRASVYVGGSPGTDDSGLMPNPGEVVINEVLAHAHAEASDWIELCNTTGKEIDIGGWFLSDANDDLFKYEIASGTKIPAYGYKVFYEGVNFGNSSFDPGKHVGFALSENGDKLYLTGALGGFVTGYRDVEEFGASLRDVSFGRYFKKSTGTSNFVAMSYNTPWIANSYPKVGPIVISEIMYNPDWPVNGSYTNDSYEYVELRNITDAPVTLYQYDRQEAWCFTEGIEYQFAGVPNEVTIPAGGYIVVVRNIGAFRWRYPEVAADKIYGPYTGVLDNAGEKLELSMPGDVDRFGVRQWIRIDRVVYSDGSHADGESAVDLWPKGADGLGSSLHRINMSAYGNDPNNWTAAAPTPGK